MGWRCGSIYEFGQHTVIALADGLTQEEIAAVTREPGEYSWSEADASLIAFVDELYEGNSVSDPTWARLTARWSPTQLVELLILAGLYWMVSGFLNTTGVQLDSGVPGWPHGRLPPG
jgi:alkylhydroperoxidase family enzyme